MASCITFSVTLIFGRVDYVEHVHLLCSMTCTSYVIPDYEVTPELWLGLHIILSVGLYMEVYYIVCTCVVILAMASFKGQFSPCGM